MESRGGRPFKFGEPTVRREFRFPESLSEKLTKYARKNGDDVSDVVREAVEAKLSGKSNASTTVSSITPEELQRAMNEALRAQRESGGLAIKLRDPDRERLEKVAEIIGYTEPQHLVEDVMRNLLRRPEEISEMLLGRGIQAFQQALEKDGRGDLVAVGRSEKARLDEKIAAVKTPAKRAAKKAA